MEPCQDCPLRSKECEIIAIEGRGPLDAPLLIVGMNPGREEKKKRQVFVGDSGKMLEHLFEKLNLQDKSIRVTNSVKCWTPDTEETKFKKYTSACRDQLLEEINQIKPKAILLLGKNAVKSLLPEKGKERINELRNRVHYFGTIPVVVTVHPSYVLRMGGEKSTTYTYLKDDLTWVSGIAYGIVEIKDDPVDYRVIQSKEEVLCLMELLLKKEMVAVDFETNTKLSKTLWKEESTPLTISFSPEPGVAYGMGLNHPESLFREDHEWIKQVFSDYLPRINLAAHNAGFEDLVFHKYYSKEINCREDTLLMYSLYNPYIRHDLHSFISNFTRITNHKLGYYQYEGRENDQIPLQTLLNANLADVDGTIRAYHKLRAEIDKEEWGFYRDYQMKMFHPVVMHMMENGMKIEQEYIRYILPHYILMENKLKDMATELFGINMSSPDQLSSMMESFGFVLPHTESGGHSTDKEALSRALKYAPKWKHGIIEFVKLFKEYTYMNKYYLSKIFKQIGDDGRVHPSFKLFGARSGRSSCSNPNLQNIAKNKEIQKMFTSDGWFLSFDFSSHEFRYFAMLMSDWDLIKAFKQGLDPHKRNAALAFNKPIDKVTKDERFTAKSISFGRLYGAGVAKLADQLGLNFDKAKVLIDQYDKNFPTIKKYYEWINYEFDTKGYFSSPFGKKWKDLANLKFSEKVNYPIQGGANYLVWESAYRAMKAGYKIVSQVHDSIVLEFDNQPTANQIKELYDIFTSIEVPGYEKESDGLWAGEWHLGQNLGTMAPL